MNNHYSQVLEYLESVKPEPHTPTRDEVIISLCECVISQASRMQKLEDQVNWLQLAEQKRCQYDK